MPLLRCWKNASRELGQIVQTEHVDVSVYPWEVERGVGANAVSRRRASASSPRKSGGYGHRATTRDARLRAAFPKERFSFPVFHEEIDWKSLSPTCRPPSCRGCPSCWRRPTSRRSARASAA